MKNSRREFMTTTGSALAALAALRPGWSLAQAADAKDPASGAVPRTINWQRHLYCPELVQLNLEMDSESARITRLGWDTEGTDRAGINLLKAPVELRMFSGDSVLNLSARVEKPDSETVRYCFPLSEEKQATWDIAVQSDILRMQVSPSGDISKKVDKM